MQKTEIRPYLKQRLPERLVVELYKLVEKYKKKGAELFIYGSFARFQDQKTSDLDLAVRWKKNRSPRIFSELYRDIQDLPTVRKIDLVDMGLVDGNFKKKVIQEGRSLLEDEISYE